MARRWLGRVMHAAVASALAILLSATTHGQETTVPPSLLVPQFLGFQANLISQHLSPMHNPYEGVNSVPGSGGTATSQSYLLSAASRLAPTLHAYLDLRSQRGAAIHNGSGLAGFPNGDFVPGGPGHPPYVSHAYLRYYLPLGSQTINIEKGIGKLPDQEPVERIEFKAGRILPTDDFDKNRYMDNPATQFFNLGLVNNPAWDFAQNDLGVTNGVMVGWFSAKWAFRIGSYQMPTTAGGADLDSRFAARNDNAELVWQPDAKGTLLRLLVYHNTARMGLYRDAVTLAQRTAQPADIATTRRSGRHKFGAGVSFETPISEDGDTGLFGCAAWNDGKTEDFSYTESDRNLCVGGQISGARWGRHADRFAVALLINALSRPHRDYLAAGGAGIQLGDGALNYGTERIIEMYYWYQVTRQVSLSPDIQFVRNPGFNRDRGPAIFVGVRLNFSTQ